MHNSDNQQPETPFAEVNFDKEALQGTTLGGALDVRSKVERALQSQASTLLGFSPEKINAIREALRMQITQHGRLIDSPETKELLTALGFREIPANQEVLEYRDKEGKRQFGYQLNEYEVFTDAIQSGPDKGMEVTTIILPDLLAESENPHTGGMARRVMEVLYRIFEGEDLQIDESAIKSAVRKNGLYPGYRGVTGVRGNVHDTAHGWISGEGLNEKDSPQAFLSSNGQRGTVEEFRDRGQAIFLGFGEK